MSTNHTTAPGHTVDHLFSQMVTALQVGDVFMMVTIGRLITHHVDYTPPLPALACLLGAAWGFFEREPDEEWRFNTPDTRWYWATPGFRIDHVQPAAHVDATAVAGIAIARQWVVRHLNPGRCFGCKKELKWGVEAIHNGHRLCWRCSRDGHW